LRNKIEAENNRQKNKDIIKLNTGVADEDASMDDGRGPNGI
jgi:hypothetical protein